jgi:A/G-specific adenine glycosylase
VTFNFSEKLLNWSSQNLRPMPWKGIQNPYFIWLSEIILQQTRVAQGLPYYTAFTTAYPTVTDLANAPLNDVLNLWQGLGYYSRARNLHAAAKYIANDLNGSFPTSYEGLKQIKGVGDYTASAIGSFAYNLDCAVIDGNVYRVLARVFGINTAIDSTEGKKEFGALAQTLLPQGKAALYNQAIMDFGATICTPKQAKCDICIFQKNCMAFAEKTIAVLPYKAKKMTKKNRFFHFFIFGNNNKIWLHKRNERDIWQDLHQFPMIETSSDAVLNDIIDTKAFENLFGESLNKNNIRIKTTTNLSQTLTHQTIFAKFYTVEQEIFIDFENKNDFFLILPKDIPTFALPKIMVDYLENHQTALF